MWGRVLWILRAPHTACRVEVDSTITKDMGMKLNWRHDTSELDLIFVAFLNKDMARVSDLFNTQLSHVKSMANLSWQSLGYPQIL